MNQRKAENITSDKLNQGSIWQINFLFEFFHFLSCDLLIHLLNVKGLTGHPLKSIINICAAGMEVS